MTACVDPNGSVLDRIKRTLVGLRMPRALEMIDATVRQLERGELSPLEAIEGLLVEEFSIRENRRVKAALVMARLSTIKTLAGFDRSAPPISWRHRKAHHFGHGAWVDPEIPSRTSWLIPST
jgi:hypothetical protein